MAFTCLAFVFLVMRSVRLCRAIETFTSQELVAMLIACLGNGLLITPKPGMAYRYEGTRASALLWCAPNQLKLSLTMPSQVFLITGTSSGFGRELVKKCLAEGDKVVATARKTSSLSFEGATEANYRAIACDVTDMK
jgi:3-oxoacyl-ACP reductase-like protein